MSVIDIFNTSTAAVPRVSSSLFGTGASGSGILDGAATVFGLAPAANVYTATSDIEAINLTINSGIKLNMNGYVLYVNGILTLVDATSIVAMDAGNANGITAGVGIASTASTLGRTGQTGSTGRSTTGNGTATSAIGTSIGAVGGTGGDSGTSTGAVGGAVTLPTVVHGSYKSLDFLMRKCRALSGTTNVVFGGSTGGGSGGATTLVDTATSGGGGAAATDLVVWARSIVGVGVLRSKGGNGGNAASTLTGSAGGGGGGAGANVYVVSGTTPLPCTVSSVGGTGGTGSGTGGTNGADGGVAGTYVFYI